MADQKITELSEDTAPVAANDFLATVRGADGLNYKVRLSKVGIGKHTVFVPAAAWAPTEDDPCSDLDLVQTSVHKVNMSVLNFDSAYPEHASCLLSYPKGWNGGTVSYRVIWTSQAADTDGVAWALKALALADGDASDSAFGSSVVVTDDAQSVAGKIYVTAESAALTISGSPGDNELVIFDIRRDTTDGNDDMAEDASLIGVIIYFTTDTNTDD